MAVPEVNMELQRLLSSIEECCPALLVCLIASGEFAPLPATHEWIDSRLDVTDIAKRIRKWTTHSP